MAAEPRASEIAALRDAIIATGRVKLPDDALWSLWCRAVPRLAGSADQRQVLTRSLEILVNEQVIELPTSQQSRMTATRLPRYAIVPSARRDGRAQPWKSYPWLRRLGWISSLPHVADDLFDDLVAINAWLAGIGDRAVPIVPVRYRSAEILGREKRLDELAATRLFGPDRLDLELLSCRRIAPPLAAAAVGPGADVLVVENSDTYWVVLESLRSVDGHGIGVVAWGSGRSFPSQVAALGVDVAGRGPVRGNTWYWGDYDPLGIDIAVAAAQAADEIAVRPAAGLWAAMAKVGVQGVGEHDWARDAGADWLGDDLWDTLQHVRTARGRVAQELVPVDVVTRWARQQ
jgi:hypothetical protein